MKAVRLLFILCALWAGLLIPASAAEFDGYVVEIDVPVRLLEASDPDFPEMEEIYAPAGLYQASDLSTVNALRAWGTLVHAEPNYIVTLDDVPPLYDDEDVFLLDAGTSEAQWYTEPLEVNWAHEQGFDGHGVRVGVVDSGLFAGHEDFEGVKILEGANYCAKEGEAARTDISDSYGHGTFVSGLIAAAYNGKGIAGLAPAVELVPLKCFEGRNGSIANIASAIYDSVDKWHCQVVNLSLGIEKDSVVLRKAIEYADKAGVVMVAAAGNLLSGEHDPDGDPLNYPAAYPQVIGVGAVDSTQTVSGFSYRNTSVEICAPGQNLRGLSCQNPAGYVPGYGTSYASPLVTAAVALTLSVRPDFDAATIRNLLKYTVRDLGSSGYDTSYGYGLLHVGHLLSAAAGDFSHQATLLRTDAALKDATSPLLLLASYDTNGALLSIQDVFTDDVDSSQNPDAVTWKFFIIDGETFCPLKTAGTLKQASAGAKET